MKNLINFLRARKSKKIQEGDMVYSRIPLDKFNNFHLFKVTKLGENSADIESNGISIKNVDLENLKRSDLFNDN